MLEYVCIPQLINMDISIAGAVLGFKIDKSDLISNHALSLATIQKLNYDEELNGSSTKSPLWQFLMYRAPFGEIQGRKVRHGRTYR